MRTKKKRMTQSQKSYCTRKTVSYKFYPPQSPVEFECGIQGFKVGSPVVQVDPASIINAY